MSLLIILPYFVSDEDQFVGREWKIFETKASCNYTVARIKSNACICSGFADKHFTGGTKLPPISHLPSPVPSVQQHNSVCDSDSDPDQLGLQPADSQFFLASEVFELTDINLVQFNSICSNLYRANSSPLQWVSQWIIAEIIV